MTPSEALRRLKYFLFRDRYTRELEEEIRLHRELRAERLQGGGLAPDAARYAAQKKFGNTTSQLERSRDMWGMEWMEHAMADLRFAIRRLRNRPGFASSTILVAALGIGATTAVFSAVDAAILRPLPFHKPEELVTLPSIRVPLDRRSFRGLGPESPYQSLTMTDVASFHDIVASVAAYAPGGLNLEDATSPRRVKVGVVTSSFFPTLGVSPAIGRVFSSEEGKPDAPRVVILSHALWRSQYAGADVIGRRIMLHGNLYEVIGVMREGFSFPSESDLWIPLTVPTTSETFAPFRGYLPSKVIARVAPGLSVDAASRRLMTEWERRSPPPEKGKRFSVEEAISEVRVSGAAIPLQQNIVGGRRKAFLILLGATTLLLLIAAANVANLLLSDGAGRRREVALREALGASRGRIVRQLLTESLLLAIAGTLVGLLVAPLTLGLLRSLLPESLAGTAMIQVNVRVLTFAATLALATGVLFGLWPALGTSRADAGEVIKSGGGLGTSSRLGATRRMLITAEIALTVMLLVGSGLMLKSFYRLMSQDFGMNTENVGTLEATFARSGVAELAVQGTPARRMEIVRRVLAQLRADRRIAAAGVINDLPLRASGGIAISIQLIGAPTPTKENYVRFLIADAGYFQAMRIPLLQGRLFEAGDDSIGQRSVIVSQALADKYWPGVTPLGRTFHFGGDTSHAYAVVGVVADVRESSLEDDLRPQLYFHVEEMGVSSIAIVARGDLPGNALLARMRAAVREASPSQAIYNLRMMREVVAKSVAPRRTNTALIAIFGALALVLSAFGVYAVVSYSVTQRSREFGIRAALGARRADILALVGGDASRLIMIGLAAGLAGAWMISRILASLLYEVDVHDFLTFALVPLVLIVPVALATLLPSLRATRVSPTEVMRAE